MLIEGTIALQYINRDGSNYGQIITEGIDWDDLIYKIRYEADHSQERFVEHFRQKYEKETDLPLWMAGAGERDT